MLAWFNHTKTAGIWVLLVVGSGCQTMMYPQLRNPGTTDYQQRLAIRYDPYPDNDIGPAVEGGRPMEFDRPLPEPAKSRQIFQQMLPGVRL